jgi:hypothetical protein
MPGTPIRPEGVYELCWEQGQDRLNLLPNPSPTFVPTAPPGWAKEYEPHLRHPNGEPQVRIAQKAKEPVRTGLFAIRFELHKADPYVHNSPRAELSAAEVSGAEPFEPFGAERWYGFSIFLPSSWIPDPASDIVTQWHQDYREPGGSSPPLAIGTRDGQWQISQHWQEPGQPFHKENVLIGDYQTDCWTDWVVHVKWSGDESSHSNGILNIWKNGQPVPQFFQKRGKNTYDGWGNYMKIGIYKWWNDENRSQSITTERIMYHDQVRIADENGSYTDVAPPPR